MPHQRATSSWPAVCEGFIGMALWPVNAVLHKTEKNAFYDFFEWVKFSEGTPSSLPKITIKKKNQKKKNK